MCRFDRFYARRRAPLGGHAGAGRCAAVEIRLLIALGRRHETPLNDLRRDLALDPGHLGRLLAALERKGLIRRQPRPRDEGRGLAGLTEAGRQALAAHDQDARQAAARQLEPMAASEQTRLVEAMRTIRLLLDDQPDDPATYLLRPHRPGDMGWVIHRHGALYAAEHGFNGAFEARIAEIAAAFIRRFDPARERCWIAERGSSMLGSVLVAKATDETAQLRLLLVEPEARRLGLGHRLVEESIRFARRAGYRRLTLRTPSCLDAARRIYAEAGFLLVETKPHRQFGPSLTDETWQLAL